MQNLTVIIPFRNGQSTIERLLDSLPRDVPIIVVDDASETPYQTPRANVRVVRRERGYFAGAVNSGIRECQTDVLVLNQDAWISDQGSVVSRQIEEWQTKGYAIAGDGVFGNSKWERGYVQGTCMFLARAAIEKVGLFNEIDYPLWGATCEWQLRACRQGFTARPTRVEGLRHERTGEFGASIEQTLKEQPNLRDWLVRTPPMISVVIACFNHGQYVREAVASLIGGKTALEQAKPQTFQSFEIIIVDDGSTDGSAKVVQSLADDWKAIRTVILPRNVGSAAAMNRGIEQAHGRYIAPLDADDLMRPDRLETLYRTALAHPHAMIYDDIQQFVDRRLSTVIPLGEYDFEAMLQQNNVHKGIFFPKQAWIDAGGYPEIMTKGREDWAFNVALGIKGWCGVHVPAAGYLYRRHATNRSYTNGGDAWRELFLRQLQSLFPKIYAGERPMGCCGKKARSQAGGARTNVKQVMGARNFDVPGAAGMVKLEYLLGKAGSQIYYGTSGTTYVFGGQRKIGYVDSRDVNGLLALMENRRNVFRVAPQATVFATEATGNTEEKTVDPNQLAAGGSLLAENSTPSAMGSELVEPSLGEETDPPEKPKRTRRKKSDGD